MPTSRQRTAVVVRDDGPANSNRHAACSTAPNDVLPRPALEPLGVHVNVEPDGQKNEETCEQGMRQQPQPEETGDH